MSARAYAGTGGGVHGRCALHNEPIPPHMRCLHLYSMKAHGELGACSVECWDALETIRDPGLYRYADDRYVNDDGSVTLPPRSCACPHVDARECLRIRAGRPLPDTCDCACHDAPATAVE